MRNRWLIWVLEGITLGVVMVIFYWQLVTLPNLRQQIISGLENDVRKLSRDAAEELTIAYSRAIIRGNLEFLSQIDADDFNPESATQIKKQLKKVAVGQKLSDAWVVVFINPANGTPTALEYKLPSRYRPNTDVLGTFQPGTELARFTEAELSRVLSRFRSLDQFNREYWASSPDSTVVLSRRPDFNPLVLTGSPVYSDKGELKGFIFNKLNFKQFEKQFIPNFFQSTLWEKGESRGNLERKHLRFGVFSTRANRLIFNSVAFGKKEFEQQEALPGVQDWFSDYVIGVGFKSSSIAEVGTSIYNRTWYVIIGMFLGLLVLVLVIFAAMRRIAVVSNLKSEFMANVTHELKTPLASILGAADTLRLRQGLTDEQRDRLFSILNKESARLQDMIHSLLDFSRLEAGRKQFRFEKVPAADLWSRVVTLVQERAGAHVGTISGEPPQAHLQVDLQAIEQVIGILTDNALKYSPERKQVDLNVSKSGRNLRIAVTDHGVGIAKEHQALVFDKFVRIGNLDQHNVKGYGIGLSIARGILQAHKGSIGVEGDLGKGSTFYFLLPLE